MASNIPPVLTATEALVEIPAHRIAGVRQTPDGLQVSLVVSKHLSALIHDALITPDPDVGPHADDVPYYLHAPELQP